MGAENTPDHGGNRGSVRRADPFEPLHQSMFRGEQSGPQGVLPCRDVDLSSSNDLGWFPPCLSPLFFRAAAQCQSLDEEGADKYSMTLCSA